MKPGATVRPTGNAQGIARRRIHWAALAGSALATIVLAIGALVVLAPIAWMLSTSLKDKIEVFLFPPTWIPHPILWSNYQEALFGTVPFDLFYRNTVLYVTLALVGEVLSCSMVAYGFARLRAPGRHLLFLLMLSTMMVPSQVTMIPQYILFRSFGWLNSYLPLIVPTYFGSAFSIFLLRQFFLGIPRDYDDAARIDGASRLQILLRVILPLAKPALVTVAIFSFMSRWNDFLGPLIYLNNSADYPVSIGLQYFQQMGPGAGITPWNLLMAATLVATLPPVFVFFFLQRYFIQGVVVSGIKG